MESMNPISEKIREIRRNRNITISELSEKIGVSKTTIIEIEKGTRKFDYQKLKEIAEALDVEVNEFIPPYVDAGRCIKMPPYTAKEVEELKLNWENKQQTKTQQEQSHHAISSISINTDAMDISDILEINKLALYLKNKR